MNLIQKVFLYLFFYNFCHKEPESYLRGGYGATQNEATTGASGFATLANSNQNLQ